MEEQIKDSRTWLVNTQDIDKAQKNPKTQMSLKLQVFLIKIY